MPELYKLYKNSGECESVTFSRTWVAKATLASCAFLALVAGNTWAAEGGYSNYIPGFYGDLLLAIAPPNGLAMRNDFYYYGADGSGSVRSGRIELSADVALTFNYLSVLYKPGIEVLGGQFAFGGTAVVGNVDIDASFSIGGQTQRIGDDRTGIGDVTFSSYIYWPKGKWNFAWGNYVVAPIGAYDVNDIANSSLNIWTFETDFMVTYFDADKGRDYSVVVGYGYNTENDDTNYQSGDEFHVDIVLNQFLSESFAIGVNGFFFRQLSGDSGAGAVLGPFKGEASGFGPAIYWIRKFGSKDVAFTLKWLNEFNVKNRLEGDHVFASFAMSF